MPFHFDGNRLWDELNVHMCNLIHFQKYIKSLINSFVELTLIVNIVLQLIHNLKK